VCHKVHEFLQACVPGAQAERALSVQLAMEQRQQVACASSSSDKAESNLKAQPCTLRVDEDVDVAAALAEMQRNFVHHGVGCDLCGLYPIVGDRYRCIQCSRSERMGYDLCGDCMAAHPETSRGRFNQHHTPDHVMDKAEINPTLMHIFQAMNPGVPLSQLQDLMRMQYGPAAGDVDGSDDELEDMPAIDDPLEGSDAEGLERAFLYGEAGSSDQSGDVPGEDGDVAHGHAAAQSPSQGVESSQAPVTSPSVLSPPAVELRGGHTHVPMFHRLPAAHAYSEPPESEQQDEQRQADQ